MLLSTSLKLWKNSVLWYQYSVNFYEFLNLNLERPIEIQWKELLNFLSLWPN